MSATKTTDVAIIGGGIIGTTLAYRLIQTGIVPTIYDRREIGREASWASAGIISPPGPRHGARSDLALTSFRDYPALIEEIEQHSGMRVGYNRTGQIEAGTTLEEQFLTTENDWRKCHGIESELLDNEALRSMEPALHERFDRGLYTPGAGSVILGRLTTAIVRAVISLGGAVKEHAAVSSIQIEGGRATHILTHTGRIPVGTVVIAAGAWSRSLGASIGFTIPTLPVRGQMMAIADPPLPVRSVIAGGGGYIVPRADGSIAIGATEEPDSGFDDRVTPAGIAWLTALLEQVVPSLTRGRLTATWAGLRPASADGEVILGRVPHLDNVWISSGHFRSGALLAPASADALASAIATGSMPEGFEALSPSRFL